MNGTRIVLAVAALAFPAVAPPSPAQAAHATCHLEVTDDGGYVWEVGRQGVNPYDGRVDVDESAEEGDGDTFDETGALGVDGNDDGTFTEYDNVDPDGCLQIGAGTEVAMPAQSIDGLGVSRRTYIDTELRFARILDLIHNPTGAAETIRVLYAADLGSDGDTTIDGTPDGDATAEVADRWVVSHQGDPRATPRSPRCGTAPRRRMRSPSSSAVRSAVPRSARSPPGATGSSTAT